MDVKIVKAATAQTSNLEENDSNELRTLIEECETTNSDGEKRKKWLDYIDKRSQTGKGVKDYVSALLTAFPVGADNALPNRIDILERVIILMHKGVLIDRQALETVNLLMNHIDTFPAGVFVGIIKGILDNFEKPVSKPYNAKVLDFFPRCLEMIVKIDGMDDFAEKNGVRSGETLKEDIFRRLCGASWPPEAIVPLISALKEITIPIEFNEKIIDKVLKEMEKIDDQTLPSAMYQLLLLSSKGFQKNILKGILQHIDARESKIKSQAELKQLREIEGTIILYIDFSMKQDQALGSQFLKLLNKEIAWTSFSLAILFSMSKIQRFEEKVLSILKSTISRYFKMRSRDNVESWNEVIPGFTQQKSMEKVLIQTAQASAQGWENITQPLVQLSSLLMDSTVSKLDSSSENLVALGQKVLLETFLNQKLVKSEIIDQILSRIVMNSENSIYFIRLLSSISSKVPQMLMEFVPKIKEAFDHLSEMQSHIAEELLESVRPILRLNERLQDHIILVLRKAMFHREEEARSTAVAGFIVLLKSLDSSINPDVGKVGYEILGFLKRCLGQQASVRERLYKGLVEVIKVQPMLKEPILDILASQFAKYYEGDERASSVINIDKCLEKSESDGRVRVVEPLHFLIDAIQQSVNTLNTESQENVSQMQSFGALLTSMDNLGSRIMKAELSDFELGDSVDFLPTSSQGIFNLETANILMGVYEVLFEILSNDLVDDAEREEHAKNVIQIFTLMESLYQIVEAKPAANGKEKKKPKKGKKGKEEEDDENEEEEGGKDTKSKSSKKVVSNALTKQVSMKERIPVVSIDSLFNLIKILGKAKKDPIAEGLRSKIGLELFVLMSFQKKLRELLKSEQFSLSVPFKKIETYAKALITWYSNSAVHHGQQSLEEYFSTSGIALECYEMIVVFMCSRVEKQYEKSASNALSFTEKEVMDFMSNTLPSSEEATPFEIMQVLITAEFDVFPNGHKVIDHSLSILARIMPFLEQKHMQGYLSWLQNLCKREITHNATAKSIVNLLLKLQSNFVEQKYEVDVRLELVKEVVLYYGKIEEGREAQDERNYDILNEKTAVSIVPAILVSLEKSCGEIEWLLTVLKSSPIPPGNDEEEFMDRVINVKDNLNERFSQTITAFSIMCSAALNVSNVSALLNAVAKCYKTLICVSKDLIDSGGKTTIVLPSSFERLVQKSGIELTPVVLKLISHFQNASNDSQAGAKFKLMKESKIVPKVVFFLEKYEAVLIRLSKLSKVPLLKKFKLTAVRDFKFVEQSEQEKNQQKQKNVKEKEKPKKKATKAKEKPKKRKKKNEEDEEEDGDAEMREASDQEEEPLKWKKKKSKK